MPLIGSDKDFRRLVMSTLAWKLMQDQASMGGKHFHCWKTDPMTANMNAVCSGGSHTVDMWTDYREPSSTAAT